MKETEKIEIMHFDQEGYLEDGKALYETGKKMTALADKVADSGRGISRIGAGFSAATENAALSYEAERLRQTRRTAARILADAKAS